MRINVRDKMGIIVPWHGCLVSFDSLSGWLWRLWSFLWKRFVGHSVGYSFNSFAKVHFRSPGAGSSLMWCSIRWRGLLWGYDDCYSWGFSVLIFFPFPSSFPIRIAWALSGAVGQWCIASVKVLGTSNEKNMNLLSSIVTPLPAIQAWCLNYGRIMRTEYELCHPECRFFDLNLQHGR
jgi:hypothetical protein